MFPLNYFKFLLTSQNQHGLHSPFVYDLVTKCFYDKKKYPEYELLRKYRKELLENNSGIKVTDFGAGSRVFRSDKRKISKIARHVGISGKRAKFLFRITNYLNCKTALELGTSLGIGTSALASNKRTEVTTVEGCPETASIAREQFEKFGLENIELKVGQFEEVLEDILRVGEKSGEWRVESQKRKENREERKEESGKRQETGNKKPQTTNKKQETTNNKPQTTNQKQETRDKKQETRDKRQEVRNQKSETPNPKQQTSNKKFDLVYFDGNHQKEATLRYFEQLLPAAHNDSVFIFDDIHWSPGMEEAWEEIKKHPEVQVTIDTFYLGLVFFRKEQARQHFKIRL